jgi:endonuclease III
LADDNRVEGDAGAAGARSGDRARVLSDVARLAFARQSLVLVHASLAAAYGLPVQAAFSPPTEELVRTILSQNTNDTNRDRALGRLRDRYPTWRAVAAAPVAGVAEAIAPGGLAQTKAPRIQGALAAIAARSQDYDLSFLCGLPLEEARTWLAALPGVGPKTVACVLLFSCGKPVMPVDTHVLRVSTRVGYLAEGTSAEAAHLFYAQVAPGDLIYPLHINLIRHGRLTCHPRRPACYACPIEDVCRYGEKTPTPAG